MSSQPAKCYFCDFYDEYFLEPHHLDGDHSNHTAENIVAVCTLCHAQNHIFALSLEKKAEICVLSTNIPQEILININVHYWCYRISLTTKILELAKFARRHRQSLLVEPLKRHQRPNPTKMSEAEYARNMFEDMQAFNAIKTRAQSN